MPNCRVSGVGFTAKPWFWRWPSGPRNADSKRLDGISKHVIGCAYAVANVLGTGFLVKVYENALTHELTKAGLMVSQQIPIGVAYDGVTVGAYVADLLVDNAVLVEIKAVRALDTSHDAQCLISSSGSRTHGAFVAEFRQSSPGDQAPDRRLPIPWPSWQSPA